MPLDEELPAEKRRHDAGRDVENAVFRLVGDESREAGPDARGDGFEVRGIYPGSDVTRWFPLPGPDLRASMVVLCAAREQVRRAVDNARGSGLSWAEIAEHLGLRPAAAEAGMDLERAGWRFAAMHVWPGQADAEDTRTSTYGPAARWRCRSCHGAISEYGPEDGVAAQSGHADGCARFERERAAERVRWEAEDDRSEAVP